MWKNFGLVVFAGLVAGGLVGVVEALQLLMAVGAANMMPCCGAALVMDSWAPPCQ